MKYYIFLTTILAAGRALDLISTRHLTPNFKLELNQWMKKVGWRNTILINIGLVLAFPLIFNKVQVVTFAVLSALMAFRNYQFIPMVKVLGESRYAECLNDYYSKTKSIEFWPPVAIKFAVVFLMGLFIIITKVVDKQGEIWFVSAIGQGLMFYSMFFAIFEIKNRLFCFRNRENVEL
jgi:hypothetical protein